MSRYKSADLVRVDLAWHECAEYLRDYMKTVPGGLDGWEYGKSCDAQHQRNWHGGPWKSMVEMLRMGTTKGLEASDELLSAVESTLDLLGLGPEYTHSVVGSTPRVAAYLMGSPNSMNRYAPDMSPRGTLNIWIGTAISGYVQQDKVTTKGIACVALARAISRYRPVNLYAYDNSAVYRRPDNLSVDVLTVVKIPTNPLDLSSLMAAVTTVAMSRGFFHNAAHAGVGNTACQAAISSAGRLYQDIRFSRRTVAELISAGPDDLVIANGYGPDIEECMESPMTWIQKQMRLSLKGEGAINRDAYAEAEITADLDARIKELASKIQGAMQ